MCDIRRKAANQRFEATVNLWPRTNHYAQSSSLRGSASTGNWRIREIRTLFRQFLS
jgi:hypothetical protein